MTHADRIDELEKKFGENPRRYFAPLANEYRKAGDLARAIEICRSHLPQQPGHMSGHIVYGQALYESRQLEEAKGVFEAALGLDPENLIALRHLGDIARDSGDPQTARVWYLRVLDADPRNDEVAGMLAELEAAGAAAPAAGSGQVGWSDIHPGGAGGSGAAAGQAGGAEQEPFRVEHASAGGDDLLASLTGAPAAAPGAGAPGEDPLAQDPMWDTGADQQLGRAAEPTPVAPIQAVAPAAHAPAPRAPGPPTSAAPSPADDSVDERTFAEVDALFDEISPEAASPPAPPAAPADLVMERAREGADTAGASTVSSEVPGLESREFVAPPREPAGPRVTGGAVPGLTSFGAETRPASATPAAFVTETMAELYLQQGFTTEALEIYQRLLEQNPDDSSLRDRVEQLQSGGRSSMSVAAVSSEIIEAARQRQAVRPIRTVRSFFGLLAGRRAPMQGATAEERAPSPPEPAPIPSPPPSAARSQTQRPTTPPRAGLTGLFGGTGISVQDEEAAMLLASAFGPSAGEQTGNNAGGAVASPTGGARARAGGEELSLDEVFREASARAAPRKSGSYSFDQFFSGPTPAVQPNRPPVDDADGGGSDPAEGDLEQFTAWLEGLKRK